MTNNNLKVGILMPTRNRADFVIRQLRYYESVNCPHAIYIGDSSDQENSEKIKNEVKKLEDKINIFYKFLPNLTRGSADAAKYLLSIVKEKYSCYSCDDDYQIPDSLTKCAEFLENNPDYATASGYAVNFRLKNNGVYGDLDRLSDCPIPAILDNKAADRLIHFLSDNFVPLFFVNRTDQMLKSHEHVSEIGDHIFSSEIVPSSLAIVAGKSATLGCLGYIRQIHSQNRAQLPPSEWIHSPEWNGSYKIFEDVISRNISQIDNIKLDDAIRVARFALSGQLLKWLSAERRTYNTNTHNISSKNDNFYNSVIKHTRSGIIKTLPFLKYIYRSKLKPKLTGKEELHYEVLRTKSPYYKDFKPVMDSFTGLIIK